MTSQKNVILDILKCEVDDATGVKNAMDVLEKYVPIVLDMSYSEFIEKYAKYAIEIMNILETEEKPVEKMIDFFKDRDPVKFAALGKVAWVRANHMANVFMYGIVGILMVKGHDVSKYQKLFEKLGCEKIVEEIEGTMDKVREIVERSEAEGEYAIQKAKEVGK